MKQWVREFRLLPVVLVAISCLFVLKVVGLVFEGGYTLGGTRTPPTNLATPATIRVASPAVSLPDPASDPSRPSWAKEMLNFPDITGTVAGKPASNDAPKESPPKEGKGKEQQLVPQPSPGKVLTLDSTPPVSAAERAILERLQERRNELDARARELEMRENVLKATEKRIESKVNELKETEARISGAGQRREEVEAARLKGLVTMYENMKAKDAARIFDRLDLGILVEITNQINPRRMADIMAQMAPEAAERLTVELARRANLAERSPPVPDLPKIEGRPAAN